ncbi:MAG: S41 family peptidase [Anaerolineae bacterium]
MKCKLVVAVLVCLLLAGCDAARPTATTTPAALLGASPTAQPTAPHTAPSPTASPAAGARPASEPSAEAQAYLDAALDLMQQFSINRDQVDWDALRRKAQSWAYGAQTAADTYRAIQYALRDLGDGHSFLMTPEQVAQMQDGTLNATVPEPSGRLLDGRIGYVSLPAFAGQGQAATEYATAVQNIIRDLAAAAPCGWIVDLRDNVGGSMWPMLAGIGPLLGEGVAGMFVAPAGAETPWSYRDGQALEGDQVQTEIEGDACRLEPLPPVAVLSGPATSSSVLSDGAWLLLTVSRFADRSGQVYGSMITPDEIVQQGTGHDDATLRAGVDWLLAQPACAADA